MSNAAALACFYRAVRVGDLSVLAPVTASGAAVPVLVGLVAGDRPTPLQAIGIPLVMAGILAAARRPPSTTGTVRTSRAIGWALLAALLFGIFLATYAGAAADSSAGALLWSRVALVATTGLGVLALRAPLRVRPRDGALVLVPGLLLALGTFAFGEASRTGLLSVVSVIATPNPVVTVVLAFLLLRERPGGLQRAGAAAALAGVGLLAAG